MSYKIKNGKVERDDKQRKVIEVCIVTPPNIAALVGEAKAGDETAMVLLGSINNWYTEQAPCIGCGAVFGAKARPGAFAVALPFADRDQVHVAAICGQCVERGEDWRQLVQRSFGGSAHVLSEPGHS